VYISSSLYPKHHTSNLMSYDRSFLVFTSFSRCQSVPMVLEFYDNQTNEGIDDRLFSLEFHKYSLLNPYVHGDLQTLDF